MRKIFYLILFILASPILFAQEVVSSSGETKTAGNIELSWTLGEPVIETFAAGSDILTQGFHQTKLVVTAISELMLNKYELSVYPNPTSEFVIVHFNMPDLNSQFELFDFSGKLLKQKAITETDTRLEMTNYASGTYILKLLDKDNQSIQSFKIVKR